MIQMFTATLRLIENMGIWTPTTDLPSMLSPRILYKKCVRVQMFTATPWLLENLGIKLLGLRM